MYILNSKNESFFWTILGGLLLGGILSLIFINWYVDPSDEIQKRDYLAAEEFAVRLRSERFGAKRPRDLALVKEAMLRAGDPKCIVLGTSQVYWLGSTPVELTPGCNERSLLNMSLPGLGLDEFAHFSSLAIKKPSRVIFLVVPFYLYSWNGAHKWPSSYRTQFQSALDEFGIVESKWTFLNQYAQPLRYLLSYQTLKNSLKLLSKEGLRPPSQSIPYQSLEEFVSIRNPGSSALLPNGAVIWPARDLIELGESNTAEYQHFLNEVKAVVFGSADRRPIGKIEEMKNKLDQIQNIVKKLGQNDKKIFLYIPPLDMDFLESQGGVEVIRFLKAYESAVIQMARDTNAQVRGGISVCTSQEFYDGFHPKPDCLDRAVVSIR